MCYCDRLVRVANRTSVLIVQHPRERFHPFGTARIVTRCLERSKLAVDYDRTLREGRRALALPEGAALLYPGKDALDLASLSASQRPSALVVLDGTWHQTRGLYRDLPALQRIPKVSFAATHPSRYRIRRQPRFECISTVEATVRALQLLEPQTRGFDAMLGAFEGMVDIQLEALQHRTPSPRCTKRPRKTGLPRWLSSGAEQIVLVYAEAAFVSEASAHKSGRALQAEPRALIQCGARRLESNESFSLLIRPQRLPLKRRLCPTGLTARDLEAGVSIEAARQAWREWLRPADRLLAWNKSTLEAMEALDDSREATFLKGIYKNFAHRRNPQQPLDGSIDAMVEREGLKLAPLTMPGRAGLRLAQLAALTRLLRDAAVSGTSLPPDQSDPRSADGRSEPNPASSAAIA